MVAGEIPYISGNSVFGSLDLSMRMLDISDRVRSGHQWGLLGLAPAPGFPADPRIFVTYTAPFEEEGLLSRVAEFSSPDGGRTFAAGSFPN